MPSMLVSSCGFTCALTATAARLSSAFFNSQYTHLVNGDTPILPRPSGYAPD